MVTENKAVVVCRLGAGDAAGRSRVQQLPEELLGAVDIFIISIVAMVS